MVLFIKQKEYVTFEVEIESAGVRANTNYVESLVHIHARCITLLVVGITLLLV